MSEDMNNGCADLVDNDGDGDIDSGDGDCMMDPVIECSQFLFATGCINNGTNQTGIGFIEVDFVSVGNVPDDYVCGLTTRTFYEQAGGFPITSQFPQPQIMPSEFPVDLQFVPFMTNAFTMNETITTEGDLECARENSPLLTFNDILSCAYTPEPPVFNNTLCSFTNNVSGINFSVDVFANLDVSSCRDMSNQVACPDFEFCSCSYTFSYTTEDSNGIEETIPPIEVLPVDDTNTASINSITTGSPVVSGSLTATCTNEYGVSDDSEIVCEIN